MNGQFNMGTGGRRSPADHFLIGSIVLLLGLGLVVLYSVSPVPSERISRIAGREYSFIGQQLVFLCMSMIFFIPALLIDPDFWRKSKVLIFFLVGVAFLCLLPLSERIGGNKNGASRWINLTFDFGGGRTFSFQPSEFIKAILPVYLAHIFARKKDRLDQVSAGVLPPVLISLGFAGLVCLQNNFSTAAFIFLNALFIFYLAGMKLRYFISAIIVALPLVVFLLFTREHRMLRVLDWLHRSDRDPLGGGYQITNSLNFITSGGFWGKGIGQGIGKMGAVPEVQADFIFASYAEETGFLGVLLFFCLIVFFAWRGYRTALGQEDMYRKLLAYGLTTIIVSQTLVNLAVVADSIPTTGIPLPFFSHGGTSLMVTMGMAGLLINLSRTSRYSASKYAGPGSKASGLYREGEGSYVR